MTGRPLTIAAGAAIVIGLGWWLVHLAFKPPTITYETTHFDPKPPAVVALSPYGLRPWMGEHGGAALRLVFGIRGGGTLAISTPERLDMYRVVEIEFRSGSFFFTLQPGSYRVRGWFVEGELGLEAATAGPPWEAYLPVQLHPERDLDGEDPSQRRLAEAIRQAAD